LKSALDVREAPKYRTRVGRWTLVAVSGLALPFAQALAQTVAPSSPPAAVPTIDVIGTTPLSGTGVDVGKVPAAVTSINSSQIAQQNSASVVKALAASTPSIDVQDVAGNKFQPDVFFRGFDASPVSGTPQGLAVYQNGVRINEAFGDTINWDLIPTVAIKSMDVISNNPAFGLNALGGALSVQMKNGFNTVGGALDVMGGSYGRLQSSLQYGKQIDNWAAYLAVEGVEDGGYRDFSSSQIRRVYGDIGYQGDSAEFHINGGAANNRFGATAAAPWQELQQNWSSVYTTPQSSNNQVGYLNATAEIEASKTWTLQGLAYVRSFYQTTVDGNSTNAQPCNDPAFLCFNDAVTPANGLNGQPLPNPFSPGATLGEIDRTTTQTTSMGTVLQATNTDALMGHSNHFVLGGSFDYGVTNFGASAELGSIQPNYLVAGSGIFLGPSGDPVSDGPVALRTTNQYDGLYTQDTFDVTKQLSISGGGRLNVAHIQLQDQLGGGVNGDDTFVHFNPMIGATYAITPELSAYGGYSQANRAPTPLELGCANPVRPCILASFLVSDPPLKQVLAQTFEAGLRGSHDYGDEVGTLGWRIGAFRTDSRDDILNIPDPIQQGFGYFQNVGATRRQGLEATVNFKADKFRLSASYAYIDATFRNGLTLGSNSPYADANGNIDVRPGDQLPMIPHNRLKFRGDYFVTPKFRIGTELTAVGSQYYVGDESNQFPKLPAYAEADIDASYQVTANLQIYADIENVLDHRYYTYGTFFDTTQIPNYGAGGAPFSDPRALSPGQPRSFYAGLKATF
jgi:outer membrane receptor protein involved in Fe transport